MTHPLDASIAPTPALTRGKLIFRDLMKMMSGALMPAAATIIFNFLNFFVENHQANPLPKPGDSVYDVTIGCVFAIFGIGVSTNDAEIGRTLLVTAVMLLIVVILGETVGPIFWNWNRLLLVWVMNAVSFVALMVAIKLG
jgi:hypothetical protein